MSIPSKATIDNLPPSVSQRYAVDELTKKSPGFYQDISSVAPPARPQVAVLEPAQFSQLDAVAGTLGQKHTLAVYSTPIQDMASDAFSFGVFPTLLEKDTGMIMDKLSTLAEGHDQASIDKVKTTITTLSELNKMGLDVFARARQLKQG